MKNNIMLKGILLFAALCSVDFVCAKITIGGHRQPVVQSDSGVASRTGTAGASVTQPGKPATEVKLSDTARLILQTNETIDKLQKALEVGRLLKDTNGRLLLSKDDIAVIEAKIKSLLREEKRSGRTKEKSQLEKDLENERLEKKELRDLILGLQRQLATQNRGFFANMRDYATAAGQYLGGAGLGAGAAWYLAATASTGGMAVGALAAAGLVKGFRYLSSKAQTGELSEYMRSFLGENLIAQAMRDSGKYPTANSRLQGIKEDMKNTGLINEKTFQEYCDNVYKNMLEERDVLYAENATLKANEEAIDSQISIIRANYSDTYRKGSKPYMEILENIGNIDNITKAQAVVSEYLRACFRVEQEQVYKKAIEEKKQKEAEAAKSQEKSSGWLSGWRWGG